MDGIFYAVKPVILYTCSAISVWEQRGKWAGTTGELRGKWQGIAQMRWI